MIKLAIKYDLRNLEKDFTNKVDAIVEEKAIEAVKKECYKKLTVFERLQVKFKYDNVRKEVVINAPKKIMDKLK